MNVLAQRLKQARQAKGLTQAAVGKIIGVTDATISRWESGEHEPDHESLGKLASLYEVSLDYLYGRTNNPKGLVIETQATHREDGYEEPLPEEALRWIEEFKQFVREKYRKKE